MTRYIASIWTPDGKIEITFDSRNGHLMEIDGNVLIIKYTDQNIKYANMPFIVSAEYIPSK